MSRRVPLYPDHVLTSIHLSEKNQFMSFLLVRAQPLFDKMSVRCHVWHLFLLLGVLFSFFHYGRRVDVRCAKPPATRLCPTAPRASAGTRCGSGQGVSTAARLPRASPRHSQKSQVYASPSVPRAQKPRQGAPTGTRGLCRYLGMLKTKLAKLHHLRRWII